MGYDKKFKEKVLEHIKKRNSQETTAKLFGIGTATIKEWKKRVKTKKGLEARIRQRKLKKIGPEKLYDNARYCVETSSEIFEGFPFPFIHHNSLSALVGSITERLPEEVMYTRVLPSLERDA